MMLHSGITLRRFVRLLRDSSALKTGEQHCEQRLHRLLGTPIWMHSLGPSATAHPRRTAWPQRTTESGGRATVAFGDWLIETLFGVSPTAQTFATVPLSPGVPADRVAALRKAFMAAFADKDLLAEARLAKDQPAAITFEAALELFKTLHIPTMRPGSQEQAIRIFFKALHAAHPPAAHGDQDTRHRCRTRSR